MLTKFHPGHIARSSSDIRTRLDIDLTKKKVQEKAEAMRELDGTPQDIAPEIGSVTVSGEKLSPFKLFQQRHRYSGNAQFNEEGHAVSLSLDGNGSRNDGYRLETLPDNSKIYVGPKPSGKKGCLLIHEKPNGVLYVDEFLSTPDYDLHSLLKDEKNYDKHEAWHRSVLGDPR